MTTAFRPFGDRVLLRRVEAETKTPGGIIIAPTAQEKPTEAVVVAVGPGRTLDNGKRVELNAKVGDRVLFGKYCGTEVRVAGEDLLVMREEDLLGAIGKQEV